MMMNNTMKEVKFTDPIYEADIVYLFGGTADDMIEYIRHNHGNEQVYSWSYPFEFLEDANTTDAYQFHINAVLGIGETFYVWMHEPTHSLMYHETFHLIGDILHTRGIEYTYQSEEAFAYLGGWIWKELMKNLEIPKIILP